MLFFVRCNLDLDQRRLIFMASFWSSFEPRWPVVLLIDVTAAKGMLINVQDRSFAGEAETGIA